MSPTKIELLIEDIYNYLESCKMQPFSTTKVIVPKDELYDFLDELRLRTPDEIKRYQKIIANRDAIITDAEEKATAMLNDAQERTNALISEHEIMQQAYQQANDIVERASIEANNMLQQAKSDAEQIRGGALSYTEEMLAGVENVLAGAYESAKSKCDGLLQSLQGYHDIVANNRKEITDQLYAPMQEELQQPQDYAEELEEYYDNPAAAKEEDFEFDENTFLEDID